MSQFRKKPVVIEAEPITRLLNQAARDWYAMPQWVRDAYEGRNDAVRTLVFTQEGIHISTLEGVMLGAPGDWLIKGVKGELYPCKPEIFAATYEPAPIEAVESLAGGGA
jgi:hypothetical protein